jgi:lanthanide-dependent methanol dehydrogenase
VSQRLLRTICMAAAAALLLAPALANEEVLSLQSDPANWVMSSGTYNGWNYSELDEINLANVQNLGVAWTFQLGVLDSHQAQPLVIGNMMYVVTPKPNYVYAIDLAQDGLITWEFRPEMPELEVAIERACCGAQTRGLAFAAGKIFYNTLDGQVFALDAENGEVLWRAENTNLDIAETMSTHPIVIGDNIVVGVMGGEFGVRGHVTAYNIETGERAWRMYSMGPNDEVGIGARFQPFYADDQAANPALDSWFGDSWKRGGGTVWGYFTYDPDANIFYYSTGNCGPWNPDYRREWGVADLDDKGGVQSFKNNYCASLLARDGTTGELIWAYNLTPQDQWDLDEPGINPLVDLEINGELRQTLIKPARNGYFYVFDRLTGEMLLEPWMFVYNDFMKGVDMETGRPLYHLDKMMFTGADPVEWCPGIAARNWHNDAYSPRTGLMYTPTNNNCQRMIVVEEDYVPGQPYRLREYVGSAPRGPGGHAGALMALNPVTSEIAWEVRYENNANTKPIMATAGDLLFHGTDEGTFVARNAMTGDIVWSFRTGSNFNISPISYVGPTGKQYILIIASQAPSSPRVAADAAPDAAARYRRAGSTMYVFALPDTFAQTGN